MIDEEGRQYYESWFTGFAIYCSGIQSDCQYANVVRSRCCKRVQWEAMSASECGSKSAHLKILHQVLALNFQLGSTQWGQQLCNQARHLACRDVPDGRADQ